MWRKDGGIKENCPKWTVFFGAFFDALDLYTIIVYHKERRGMKRKEDDYDINISSYFYSNS